MPEIEFRQAANDDWEFISLLLKPELKSYLSSVWPHQKDSNQFFNLKKSHFNLGRTTIISFKGVDIGRIALKETQDTIYIEEIQLWYDTEQLEISQAVIEQMVLERLTLVGQAKCSLHFDNPLNDLMNKLGFSCYYQTEQRNYYRIVA
ncbi:MAG: hypothetical protein ACPGUD_11235 [Parashewanella sp.]